VKQIKPMLKAFIVHQPVLLSIDMKLKGRLNILFYIIYKKSFRLINNKYFTKQN